MSKEELKKMTGRASSWNLLQENETRAVMLAVSR
jgi:hypothetical protein